MTDHQHIHNDLGRTQSHPVTHQLAHHHLIDHHTKALHTDSPKTPHLVDIITQPLQNHRDNTINMTLPLAQNLLHTTLTLNKTTPLLEIIILLLDKTITAVHHRLIDQTKIINQIGIIIQGITELRNELRHHIILNPQITTIDLTKPDHTPLKTIQETTKDLQTTADQIRQPVDPITPDICPE